MPTTRDSDCASSSCSSSSSDSGPSSSSVLAKSGSSSVLKLLPIPAAPNKGAAAANAAASSLLDAGEADGEERMVAAVNSLRVSGSASAAAVQCSSEGLAAGRQHALLLLGFDPGSLLQLCRQFQAYGADANEEWTDQRYY